MGGVTHTSERQHGAQSFNLHIEKRGARGPVVVFESGQGTDLAAWPAKVRDMLGIQSQAATDHHVEGWR